MADNVMSALIKERDRVRDLEKEYLALEGPGVYVGFALDVVIRPALQRADNAINSGDVVQIVSSLAELRDCK